MVLALNPRDQHAVTADRGTAISDSQGATADIAVVGSGVLALATAFELVEQEANVVVIGPRDGTFPGQASRAAGAMLTVFSEVEASHPQERTAVEVAERVRARDSYDAWLARIGAASHHSLDVVPGLWVIGNGLGVDDAAELKAIASATEQFGHRADFASAADIPGLAPQVRAHQAVWLPYEASIDTAALMTALTAALMKNSRCQWLDTTAARMAERRDRIALMTADGDQVVAEHVVLAAGVGIPALLANSDMDERVAAPPLWSGRGVSLTVRAPFAVPTGVRTANRGFACGSHMVPRGDGIVYVGATNRLSTEPDFAAASSLDEVATLIHDAASELNVGLREASLLDVRVGHRPVTIDHLPMVGRTGHPQIHLATGTYRCGVLLAPRIAQMVVDGIADPAEGSDHPYSPRRAIDAPMLEDFLDSAVHGLVEVICQPGGRLPAGAADKLAHFLHAALAEIAAGDATRATTIRRLWARAPMVECVPLLMDAVGRVG